MAEPDASVLATLIGGACSIFSMLIGCYFGFLLGRKKTQAEIANLKVSTLSAIAKNASEYRNIDKQLSHKIISITSAGISNDKEQAINLRNDACHLFSEQVVPAYIELIEQRACLCLDEASIEELLNVEVFTELDQYNEYIIALNIDYFKDQSPIVLTKRKFMCLYTLLNKCSSTGQAALRTKLSSKTERLLRQPE